MKYLHEEIINDQNTRAWIYEELHNRVQRTTYAVRVRLIQHALATYIFDNTKREIPKLLRADLWSHYP